MTLRDAQEREIAAAALKPPHTRVLQEGAITSEGRWVLSQAERAEIVREAGPHRTIEFHFCRDRRGNLHCDGAKILGKRPRTT